MDTSTKHRHDGRRPRHPVLSVIAAVVGLLFLYGSAMVLIHSIRTGNGLFFSLLVAGVGGLVGVFALGYAFQLMPGLAGFREPARDATHRKHARHRAAREHARSHHGD